MTGALFHECLADALRECIAACGGTKAVGLRLWPEKGADVAARRLADCLNDSKPEKLSPDQVLLILRMAREANCHAGATYILRELGYQDPVPVEPADERALLQREYIEAARQMARLADRIERTQGPALRSAA